MSDAEDQSMRLQSRTREPALAMAETSAAAGDERSLRWRRLARIAVVAGIGLLLLLPLGIGSFWLRVMTTALMLAAMAQSLNIITGFSGRADFGNVVYFGIGAYTTAYLSTLGVPIVIGIPIGAALCALVAFLIGFPILRLRGHYFAIATIGVLEGTRELVINLDFLGGGAGLSTPIFRLAPDIFFGAIYYAMLGLMLAYTLLVWQLSRSGFGYGLRAIKADEEAAGVMGINTRRAKTMAWAISAGCTAMVGGVYAVWVGFLEPSNVFDVVLAVQIFIMMLLGGGGTVFGPILGAFLLHLIQVTVWSRFLEGHAAILGVVVVLVVLFIPSGLVPTVRRRLALR